MDITIYLPDEIGRWAKDHGLNLSGLLRAEIGAERERQEAIAKLTEGEPETFILELDDRTVRLHGRAIIEEQNDGVQVFVGEDDCARRSRRRSQTTPTMSLSSAPSS